MYTLIAYKPESHTMSWGYVCDSWAADFNIHSYIEHKDLVNLCADYASRRREDGENAYKLTINTVYDDQLFTCEDLMEDLLQDEKICALYDEVLIRIHEQKYGINSDHNKKLQELNHNLRVILEEKRVQQHGTKKHLRSEAKIADLTEQARLVKTEWDELTLKSRNEYPDYIEDLSFNDISVDSDGCDKIEFFTLEDWFNKNLQ